MHNEFTAIPRTGWTMVCGVLSRKLRANGQGKTKGECLKASRRLLI